MSSTTIQDKPNIPAEMLKERRWVAWVYVLRDGKLKPDKVPIDPETGGLASPTDERTWGTYDQAIRRAAKNGLAGVGFMLGDGWVGVDFDKFRDEDGYLSEPVPSAVRTFGTYAEVSPSNTGVKIIGRGQIPEGLKNRTGKDEAEREIEVYDSGRFFTVTGDKLDEAPATVREMPEEFEVFCRKFLPAKAPTAPTGSPHVGVSELSDDEVIRRIEASGQAEKFNRLMAGNTTGYPSASNADMSLAGILVSWTGGNPEQMERIMCRSALSNGREQKWARRDYLSKLTIPNAINMHRSNGGDFYRPNGNSFSANDEKVSPNGHPNGSLEFYRPEDPTEGQPTWRDRVVSLSGRGKPKPRVWIVKNLIPEKLTSAIYGAGGMAKSLLMADLQLALVNPRVDTWLGMECATRPVLYADFEQSEDEMHRRFWRLSRGRGLSDVPGGVEYLPRGVLSTAGVFEDILGWGRDNPDGVVIIDSVGFAVEGDAEKATDVMDFYRNHVAILEAHGLTPMLIDHQSKVIKGDNYWSKTQFGSVYKFNSARSVIQVGGHSWEGTFKGKFKHQKTNVGPEVHDTGYRITFDDGNDRINIETLAEIPEDVEDGRTAKTKLYLALAGAGDQARTAKELALIVNEDLKTVQNNLTALQKDGRAEVASKGGESGKEKLWKHRSEL